MAYVANGTFVNRYQPADGQRLSMKGFAEYMNVLTGESYQPTTIPNGTNFGDYPYWNGKSYSIGDNRVLLGSFAGQYNQQNNTIAIGNSAGNTNQSDSAVAIGNNAGNTNQGVSSIAIGTKTGYKNQGNNSIAIGNNSGSFFQGSSSISIGNNAGRTHQGNHSIAIGSYAGSINQGTGSIAIGYRSGFLNQASNSIAIGYKAFETDGPANSICINASPTALNGSNTNSLYINPIRIVDDPGASYTLVYNTLTSEVTAGNFISNVSMTGIPGFVSGTSPAITTLQTLNMPNPPNDSGSYVLNVQYNLSFTGTIGQVYTFYVTDSVNPLVSGAGTITNIPFLFSEVTCINNVIGYGFLNRAGDNGPFVYVNNINNTFTPIPPVLNLILDSAGNDFTILSTSIPSKFQAYYIPA